MSWLCFVVRVLADGFLHLRRLSAPSSRLPTNLTTHAVTSRECDSYFGLSRMSLSLSSFSFLKQVYVPLLHYLLFFCVNPDHMRVLGGVHQLIVHPCPWIVDISVFFHY